MKPRLLSPCLLAAAFVQGTVAVAATGITHDGAYWRLDGQRTLLIGAWNHGHNPFLDHDTRDGRPVSTLAEIAAHLDELRAAGGNLLRCVLDPGDGTAHGFLFCAQREGKFDLSAIGGSYWERLAAFLQLARDRGHVVKVEIWDRFDLIGDHWQASPFRPANNRNYTPESSGLADRYETYRNHPFLETVPGHPKYVAAPADQRARADRLRSFQEKFVDQLLSVALPFGNVIYDMNNETHADPAWGIYWMNYVRAQARRQGKAALCTDMFNDLFNYPQPSQFDFLIAHPEHYDYFELSQINSRNRDEVHWRQVQPMVEASRRVHRLVHLTKIYGSDDAFDGAPWSRWRPGDTNNAIEEWWRSLIAGVAGLRFHRPTAGPGLIEETANCLRATRLVETRVKFWEVTPRMELLSGREEDEAYLAAAPGQKYVLYFTRDGGGAVGLELAGIPGVAFELAWIDITRGTWGPAAIVTGGTVVRLSRPDSQAHWVAVLTRKS